ncbi:Ig-like and fibronectin type-III domain-containing protein 1 [Ruditapes philippinarum]|uniref:Ig-like and fibronectin type-III domain-containing protein 1 n=1 Tax=Ruditapes philippinarum TaxID=129788 RepID=UPI00295AE7B5|nr:Ig-like and fibronectin type-III domain-containing protein 1 [Ruditapes philippinarum]
METIMYQATIFLASILTVFGQTIETTSQTIKIEVGKVAQFECKVKNLQPSQTVKWDFIDHNITISKGSVIHAENYENKYSIYGPQDGGGYWNLQIYPVLMTDAGTYKCYVDGAADSVKVIHHLLIANAPPVPSIPALNVTDCCVTNGVEKCALPFCDTSTSILDLIKITIADNGDCISRNILQILKCGQDGRNHLGCCMRNGLSDLCQNLCKGWGEDDGTDYTSCISDAQIMSYITCFKEGNALLPSPPTDVSAINTGNSLLVTWQPPHDNPDVVVGYKVQYMEEGSDVLNSTSLLRLNSLVKELTNLELNVVYEIQVVAIASSGASQPSLPILKSTAEVVPLSNYTQTIQDCCKKYNVTSDCQGYCAASLYYTGGHPDMLKCLSELDIIYQCIAGHGDHSPCCMVSGVPSECLSLCKGEPILDWSITGCLSYMNRISACLIEGSVMMPDPPQNTRILAETVTDTSAVVAWEAPGNFKSGDEYLVSWKKDKDIFNEWKSAEIKFGTTYKITNLEPGTKYDVVVSTENENGSSLPELTLILITEG